MTDPFSAALLRIQQRIAHGACVALAEIEDAVISARKYINRSCGQRMRQQKAGRKPRSKR